MFPQNPSERHGALAVSDLVRILLSHNDLVRLLLMAPNISPFLYFKWTWWSSTLSWKIWDISNLQKTENKKNTMSKRITVPINIQKECLKTLKGLNPCNASSTLFSISPGWIMGSLLFWISKILYAKPSSLYLNLYGTKLPVDDA
jgi:hypothetical protein